MTNDRDWRTRCVLALGVAGSMMVGIVMLGLIVLGILLIARALS